MEEVLSTLITYREPTEQALASLMLLAATPTTQWPHHRPSQDLSKEEPIDSDTEPRTQWAGQTGVPLVTSNPLKYQ